MNSLVTMNVSSLETQKGFLFDSLNHCSEYERLDGCKFVSSQTLGNTFGASTLWNSTLKCLLCQCHPFSAFWECVCFWTDVLLCLPNITWCSIRQWNAMLWAEPKWIYNTVKKSLRYFIVLYGLYILYIVY